MNSEVIVSCAVTGAGDTVGKHPGIPVTPKQIADAAIEAAKAGAAIAHIHVRDPKTGKGSRDPALYREVVERVRDAKYGAAMLVVDQFHWVLALFCLIVSVSLQIGVNYANDYSDGVRGSDEVRVGPVRLVAAGLAAPRQVLSAAFGCFAAAGAAGLALAAVTSWWLVAVGAACIAAAWFYTGGPRPYGYHGLGEVFVFTFFGVVAVAGTAYVQMGRFSWLALAASVPAGSFQPS